eukprot:Opistho-2@27553
MTALPRSAMHPVCAAASTRASARAGYSRRLLWGFAMHALLAASLYAVVSAHESHDGPSFGVEMEFAGMGKMRIPHINDIPQENYEAVIATFARGVFGADFPAIHHEVTPVPHPRFPNKYEPRRVRTSSWIDPKGRTWKVTSEYVTTTGIYDGYEVVFPPLVDPSEAEAVALALWSSGLVGRGAKSASHVHVNGTCLLGGDGASMSTPALGLANLLVMHEKIEPLIRRLFATRHFGGSRNPFSRTISEVHPGLVERVGEISADGDISFVTVGGLKNVFDDYLDAELAFVGLSSDAATGNSAASMERFSTMKRIWKYHSLNIANLIPVNPTYTGRKTTVEFRAFDLLSAEAVRLAVKFCRALVEKACADASQQIAVSIDGRLPQVPLGGESAVDLLPSNPADVRALAIELLKSLSLDPSEFESLLVGIKDETSEDWAEVLPNERSVARDARIDSRKKREAAAKAKADKVARAADAAVRTAQAIDARRPENENPAMPNEEMPVVADLWASLEGESVDYDEYAGEDAMDPDTEFPDENTHELLSDAVRRDIDDVRRDFGTAGAQYTNVRQRADWIGDVMSDGEEGKALVVDEVAEAEFNIEDNEDEESIDLFAYGTLGTCNPNPCQNGGTCVDEDKGFFCECTDDYYGEFCQYGMFTSTETRTATATNTATATMTVTATHTLIKSSTIKPHATSESSPAPTHTSSLKPSSHHTTPPARPTSTVHVSHLSSSSAAAVGSSYVPPPVKSKSASVSSSASHSPSASASASASKSASASSSASPSPSASGSSSVSASSAEESIAASSTVLTETVRSVRSAEPHISSTSIPSSAPTVLTTSFVLSSSATSTATAKASTTSSQPRSTSNPSAAARKAAIKIAFANVNQATFQAQYEAGFKNAIASAVSKALAKNALAFRKRRETVISTVGSDDVVILQYIQVGTTLEVVFYVAVMGADGEIVIPGDVLLAAVLAAQDAIAAALGLSITGIASSPLPDPDDGGGGGGGTSNSGSGGGGSSMGLAIGAAVGGVAVIGGVVGLLVYRRKRVSGSYGLQRVNIRNEEGGVVSDPAVLAMQGTIASPPEVVTMDNGTVVEIRRTESPNGDVGAGCTSGAVAASLSRRGSESYAMSAVGSVPTPIINDMRVSWRGSGPISASDDEHPAAQAGKAPGTAVASASKHVPTVAIAPADSDSSRPRRGSRGSSQRSEDSSGKSADISNVFIDAPEESSHTNLRVAASLGNVSETHSNLNVPLEGMQIAADSSGSTIDM